MNTYNQYPKNVFNIINISHIILHYNDKDLDIRNKVINNIINNDYNNKIKLISTKVSSFHELFSKKILSYRIFKIEEDNYQNRNKISQNYDRFNYQFPLKDKKLQLYYHNKNYNFPLSKKINNDINKPFGDINNLLFNSFQLEQNNNNNINIFGNLFDKIFYNDKKLDIINFNEITKNQLETLKNKYLKYKDDLINSFDNYFKNNISHIFKREDINKKDIEIIKYNIEAILNCFELDRNKYKRYYPKNRKFSSVSKKKPNEKKIWKY